MAPQPIISFQCKDCRGERLRHAVAVRDVGHGATQWHAALQWPLRAVDLKNRETRLFALTDMTEIAHGR
jgi:hypothetical protein